MMVLHQKKVKLVNDVISRRDHDYSSVIYLTAVKLSQCRLVDENRIEKEEAKNKTAKKTATQKLHLQKKLCKDFQNFQESMNSLL